MRLRQCVFVTRELESSREELCDILGIEVAYRDPGVAKWGLVNVVCPTGHDFLEIVTPFQEGTSAGRYIDRRKGDDDIAERLVCGVRTWSPKADDRPTPVRQKEPRDDS